MTVMLASKPLKSQMNARDYFTAKSSSKILLLGD